MVGKQPVLTRAAAFLGHVSEVLDPRSLCALIFLQSEPRVRTGLKYESTLTH